MKIKKLLAYLGKAAAAGVIAFIALTLFCCLYYNTPAAVECTDGATDWKWEPGVFYSKGTEGFASGSINNDGYVNAFDYDPQAGVDVLVMGPSHMQGFEVMEKNTTAAQLGRLMPDKTVYNIGMSEHYFLTCAVNLSAAAEKYRPRDYIVIATQTVSFSEYDLGRALNGEGEEHSIHFGGIIGALKRNQFIRLVYTQQKNYFELRGANAEEARSEETPDLLGTLLGKMSAEANGYGAKIIVLYHPTVSVNADATLSLSGELEDTARFGELCAQNGVIFVNMTERFREEYNNNRVLPYGFTNTAVGVGHLNREGHAMIADELYSVMMEG